MYLLLFLILFSSCRILPSVSEKEVVRGYDKMVVCRDSLYNNVVKNMGRSCRVEMKEVLFSRPDSGGRVYAESVRLWRIVEDDSVRVRSESSAVGGVSVNASAVEVEDVRRERRVAPWWWVLAGVMTGGIIWGVRRFFKN
ncbi:MAG: hypothetical protein SOR57_06855 [Parabacteroides sp.]|nr:hypothetical protein [Parabacteroides sp.]